MRILYVIPEYPPQYGGGIGTHYDVLISAMQAQGHDVDVLVGSAFTGRHDARESESGRVTFLDPAHRERVVDRMADYEALPQLRRTLAAAAVCFQPISLSCALFFSLSYVFSSQRVACGDAFSTPSGGRNSSWPRAWGCRTPWGEAVTISPTWNADCTVATP